MTSLEPLGSEKSRHALYSARLSRLRAVMRQRDLPALLILDPINILYATGARNMTLFAQRTPARYLLLTAEGPAILYDYQGCEHLAEGLPTLDDIRPARGLCYVSSGGDPQAAAASFADDIAAAIEDVVAGEKRLAVDRFPMAAIDALRARGFHLSDADAVLSEARAIKLPVELPYLREAMARVEVAASEMAAAIAPGRSETEIWADFHRAFIADEGEYISTRLMQSGPRTYPYFQECGRRLVEAGDLVCFDSDALGFQGYAVDFSRSFLCGDGPASGEQRKLYGRAREQLDWNVDLIKPGASFEEIAARAWPIPEDHLDSRYYCIGHGLGMSGEFPNIPHRTPGEAYPLAGRVAPGMVLCIESYLGSAASGQGVKLEDQLLVTETGVERMSRFPFEDRLMAREV